MNLKCCQCEELFSEEDIRLTQISDDERDVRTCQRCEVFCDIQDLAHEASADAAHGALMDSLTTEGVDRRCYVVHSAALDAAREAAREVLRTALPAVDEHLESQAFELAEGVAATVAAETLDGKDCRLRGHGRSHLLSFVLNGRFEDNVSQRFQHFARQVDEENLRARLRLQMRSILEMAKARSVDADSSSYDDQTDADQKVAVGGRL